MNGTTEPPENFSESSLICMHQNARSEGRHKFHWGERHLRWFCGRLQRPLGGEEGTFGLERTPENTHSTF